MSKTCNICAALKPLSDFYPSKCTKDGHTTTCKACMIARARARQAEIDADPARKAEDLEKRRARHDRWKTEGRPHAVKSGDKWKKQHNDVVRKHSAVHRAIRKGTLVKQPCEECLAAGLPCEASRSMAIHDVAVTPQNPFGIRWLCSMHAGRARTQNRKKK